MVTTGGMVSMEVPNPPPPAGAWSGSAQAGPGRPEDNVSRGGVAGAVNSMRDSRIGTFLKSAGHPVACIFHLVFKAVCFLAYLYGRYAPSEIASTYVTTFVFTTIASALDFWTVKNITGRLLVGLRWWNIVSDEDGTSSWVFESNPHEDKVNAADRRIFWVGLWGWTAFWAVIIFLNLFAFDFRWLLLDLMVFVFAAMNLAGFWKCSKEAKKQAQEWVQNQGASVVTAGLLNRFS